MYVYNHIFRKNHLFISDAYEFDSWKKFFEYTKQQESRILFNYIQIPFSFFVSLDEKRLKSAGGVGASKDKKIAPAAAAAGKLERGKVSIFKYPIKANRTTVSHFEIQS